MLDAGSYLYQFCYRPARGLIPSSVARVGPKPKADPISKAVRCPGSLNSLAAESVEWARDEKNDNRVAQLVIKEIQ